MMPAFAHFLHGFNIFMIAYVLLLQMIYTILAIAGWRAIENYVRRRPMRDYRSVSESEMSMPVSILVPAYNEEPSIVAALGSLLKSQFIEFEIVVINDGSKDATLAVLKDAFGLVEVGRVPRSNLPTQHVRAVYTSPLEPRIVVIDKVNGGKADALNAGINHPTSRFSVRSTATRCSTRAPSRGSSGSSRRRRRRLPSGGSSVS